MEKQAFTAQSRLTERTVEVILAYLSKNTIASSEVASLIAAVHSALAAAANPQVEQASPDRPTQAEIRRSVRPEGIISFIDGKTYKTLKRHLGKHGLDPQSYRERYGLPQDYLMVAPDYSVTRSALAHSLGLGKLRRRYRDPFI